MFWDFKIGDLNIYSIVSGFISLLNLIYVLVQFFKPNSDQDKYFLLTSHVCSYGGMYFAVRSIDSSSEKYRRDRVEFEKEFIFGKIAFY
jgi:hypothetical protein